MVEQADIHKTTEDGALSNVFMQLKFASIMSATFLYSDPSLRFQHIVRNGSSDHSLLFAITATMSRLALVQRLPCPILQ
jgi:hypothetical protein